MTVEMRGEFPAQAAQWIMRARAATLTAAQVTRNVAQTSIRFIRGAALTSAYTIRDTSLFVRALHRSPAGVGAVLPSSAALAAAITQELHADSGPVLELGAGTGVFSRKMLKIGIPAQDLILIELDADLADNLRERFPDALVLCRDASRLYRAPVAQALHVRAAVCGLPLRNMPLRCKLGILRGVFEALETDGALYLFSYGLRCPIEARLLERLGLRARRIQVVYRNAPPARVWKITRRVAVFKR